MTGIAISGRAGSGKSTLASILYDWLGAAGGARVCPVAEALKWEVWDLYGLQKGMPGGREKLIEHGETLRLADPLYWVRKVDARCNGVRYSGKVPIVDDLRFPAEVEWARSSGMLLVRVIAPVGSRVLRLERQGLRGDFAYSGEAGETSLDGVLDWDVTVSNVTPAALLEGARNVMRAYWEGVNDGDSLVRGLRRVVPPVAAA